MFHLSAEAVQSVASVAFVVALFAAAAILPYVAGLGHMRGRQRWTFLWLVFDAFIHLLFEGPFVYLSIFGRTVNTSRGFFASIWQEYSHADARWAVADAGVVSVEVLTVVLGGPLAAYAAYSVAKNDARCHFWIAILCTAELYGDFVCSALAWISSSRSDDVCTRVDHRQSCTCNAAKKYLAKGAPVP